MCMNNGIEKEIEILDTEIKKIEKQKFVKNSLHKFIESMENTFSRLHIIAILLTLGCFTLLIYAYKFSSIGKGHIFNLGFSLIIVFALLIIWLPRPINHRNLLLLEQKILTFDGVLPKDTLDSLNKEFKNAFEQRTLTVSKVLNTIEQYFPEQKEQLKELKEKRELAYNKRP